MIVTSSRSVCQIGQRSHGGAGSPVSTLSGYSEPEKEREGEFSSAVHHQHIIIIFIRCITRVSVKLPEEFMHVCASVAAMFLCIMYCVKVSSTKNQITLYSVSLLLLYCCFGRMITLSVSARGWCRLWNRFRRRCGPSIGLCCCIFMRLNYKSIIPSKTP
jgi:hypothetical protein